MISNTGKLAGKTLFITGASRGIGKAIALKAAKDGANVVIAAKTAEPHPKLPGTIYTAAEEIEKAGGKALPCIVDVRDENQVRNAVQQAVEKFGGIDVVINNASAISLTSTTETNMKRYDLMHNINTRGTFLVSKECIPYLLKSNHAHILNLSPPLNMNPFWFEKNLAYTMAKYGMSMCVLGMSKEFEGDIGVNALWPKTTVYTAAMELLAGNESYKYSRKVDVMADAAYAIICQDPKLCTGNFFIDESLLKEKGITDFKPYACVSENADNLMPDAFLDEEADFRTFGGIDILVNNASAISLTPTSQTDMKRYDLMHNINTRGTFLASKECIPYLLKSNHAHILNLSPPLNLNPMWFSNHVAYTMAKYGMSMCVLGMAREFEGKIGVNALWPRTAIHTAAMEMLAGDESSLYSRKPEIVSDAAYAIFCRSPVSCSGNFFIDEKVLEEEGITDLKPYACVPENANKLMPDFFLDVDPAKIAKDFVHGGHLADVTTGAQDGKIPQLFKKIEQLINEELVNKTKAVFQFNVLGAEKGVWYIDLKTGSGKCGSGEPEVKADAILTMDSRNFHDMFTGKLKATSAFMSGKLKISGDLQKAMKLEKLMVGLKSKS